MKMQPGTTIAPGETFICAQTVEQKRTESSIEKPTAETTPCPSPNEASSEYVQSIFWSPMRA
jgi:hypothetical protein